MAGINRLLRKEIWIKSVKITLASLLSLALAGELGLQYSSTAGIITILSIQKTKRETVKSAAKRGIAFLCALVLAAVSFALLGFTLPAFGVYLLLFALLCLNMGWTEAITSVSVLVTHFLAEGSMSLSTIINEALIFLIGTGTGILVNLHLHRRQDEFDRLAGEVDTQIKAVLRHMSRYLATKCLVTETVATDCVATNSQTSDSEFHFEKLEKSLEAAGLCATANYNNQFRPTDTYELEYIRMREQQSTVLQGIYKNIKSLHHLPVQAAQIADLLQEIESCYHKTNTAEAILARLDQFYRTMEQQELPKTRREFEARAILFYILKQLEELLILKRNFMLQHGKICCNFPIKSVQ